MSMFATWPHLADDGHGDAAAAPRIHQGSHVSPGDDDPRGGWLELGAIPDRARAELLHSPLTRSLDTRHP
ncbi:hypothetical protein ACFRMQ_27980 [Kitasatospora sp. NPDC056783]|uniref:hypothetical protein n=1 Tax=Kitasatospora sp. NPDC056783 TaxID=3345943 RepID=UPI0036B1ABB5